MNLAKAFGGGYPSSTLGMLQSWENQEGAHTPSGSKTPIVICGWLLKRKREHRKFRSTWNRRWFTVEDGAFHWYKTSSSDACGRLSLMDISRVRKSAGHGNFTFIVHSTDRDMLLRAETANDESRWIRGLTLQIDLVHGGTFQGPPSAKNRRRTVINETGGDGSSSSTGKYRNRDTGWETSHYREINNRIRAIMNDRDGGLVESSAGRLTSTLDQGSLASLTGDYRTTTKKMMPRDPRGISVAGGYSARRSLTMSRVNYDCSGGRSLEGWRRGQAKVLPISSPRSLSPKDTSNSISDNRDCVVSSGRVPSSPPMPSGPPPANGRGRRSSSRPTISTPSSRDEIVDIPGTSDCEEDFDDHWGRHGSSGSGLPARKLSSPAGTCGLRTSKQRRHCSGRPREDRYNGGERMSAGQWREAGGRAGSSSQARRENGGRDGRDGRDQKQRFDDLENFSSSELSAQTGDDPFMNDFFSMDTARSSSSSHRTATQSPSNNCRDDIVTGKQRRRLGPSHDSAASLPCPSSSKRRPSKINFDDDESSKEGFFIDYPRNYLNQPCYDFEGAGGGGVRGSSGGSITAEDSWSIGMGGGYDDETPSSSRLASSGRSSSRSSSSRRYLVEQNEFRQGW